MTITKATEAILKYFEENTDVFNECIEDLDSYNGCLGDDRWYEMEMLEEFYADSKPMDLLYRAFYGYDEDEDLSELFDELECDSDEDEDEEE